MGMVLLSASSSPIFVKSSTEVGGRKREERGKRRQGGERRKGESEIE